MQEDKEQSKELNSLVATNGARGKNTSPPRLSSEPNSPDLFTCPEQPVDSSFFEKLSEYGWQLQRPNNPTPLQQSSSPELPCYEETEPVGELPEA